MPPKGKEGKISRELSIRVHTSHTNLRNGNKNWKANMKGFLRKGFINTKRQGRCDMTRIIYFSSPQTVLSVHNTLIQWIIKDMESSIDEAYLSKNDSVQINDRRNYGTKDISIRIFDREDKTEEDKSSEDMSTDERGTEDKTEEDKSPEDKSLEDKSTDERGTEEKGTENVAMSVE